MLLTDRVTVDACCLVNEPVPLMTLANVTALDRSNTNEALLVTVPEPSEPVVVLFPTFSVPPLMVVLA